MPDVHQAKWIRKRSMSRKEGEECGRVDGKVVDPLAGARTVREVSADPSSCQSAGGCSGGKG